MKQGANCRPPKVVVQDTKSVAKSKTNDFSWYNRFSQFTEYAGTVPFGTPIGNSLELWQTGAKFSNIAVPGLMSLRFIPGVGHSANNNSPINRSSIRWYSTMRMKQQASGRYDQQDMMIGLIALDSANMFHAWLKRILGIANVSDPMNRYKPDVLLMANGVDPDDVRDNPADYWGYLNKFAADMAHFVIPKEFNLYKRHQWMVSGIYRDADADRAQMYMFVPDGFWVYDNTQTVGSTLNYQRLPITEGGQVPTYMKLSDIQAIGNAIMLGLCNDEDISQICGDLRNALGDSGMVGLEETPRDYKILSTYDVRVLSQIENAVVMPADFTNNVITQNPSVNNGAILYQPKFKNGNVYYNQAWQGRNALINFHMSGKPDVESVIEATRLTAIYEGTFPSDIADYWEPTVYGTEILIEMRMWIINNDGNTFSKQPIPYPFNNTIVINPTAGTYGQSLDQIAQLACFDWHPQVAVFRTVGSGASQYLAFCGMLLDYDLTATVAPSKILDMHDASIMSMLYIGE